MGGKVSGEGSEDEGECECECECEGEGECASKVERRFVFGFPRVSRSRVDIAPCLWLCYEDGTSYHLVSGPSRPMSDSSLSANKSVSSKGMYSMSSSESSPLRIFSSSALYGEWYLSGASKSSPFVSSSLLGAVLSSVSLRSACQIRI